MLHARILSVFPRRVAGTSAMQVQQCTHSAWNIVSVALGRASTSPKLPFSSALQLQSRTFSVTRMTEEKEEMVENELFKLFASDFGERLSHLVQADEEFDFVQASCREDDLYFFCAGDQENVEQRRGGKACH